jgi:hypothetical protein
MTEGAVIGIGGWRERSRFEPNTYHHLAIWPLTSTYMV